MKIKFLFLVFHCSLLALCQFFNLTVAYSPVYSAHTGRHGGQLTAAPTLTHSQQTAPLHYPLPQAATALSRPGLSLAGRIQRRPPALLLTTRHTMTDPVCDSARTLPLLQTGSRCFRTLYSSEIRFGHPLTASYTSKQAKRRDDVFLFKIL